jgi:hypothetical protein
MENALRDQSELRHKREQIETALSSGWEYAGRYDEFREKLRQVNRSLRESGSQVDDKQEFAALDPEAFQRCEIDEPRVEEAKESCVTAAPAAATTEIPAPLTAAQSLAITDAGTPQPSAIAEERPPTSPSITLDDLRRQLDRTPKRRSASASSAAAEATQMSLF